MTGVNPFARIPSQKHLILGKLASAFGQRGRLGSCRGAAGGVFGQGGVFEQAIEGALCSSLDQPQLVADLAPGAPLCAQGSNPGGVRDYMRSAEELSFGAGISQAYEKVYRHPDSGSPEHVLAGLNLDP